MVTLNQHNPLTDVYDHDRQRQVGLQPFGLQRPLRPAASTVALNGLGGLGNAALGTVEDVVATVTQGNLWLTLALGGVLGVLLWPKAKKLLKG